jgi:predicted  nucleic acid-binding Zn-ribbon protein
MIKANDSKNKVAFPYYCLQEKDLKEAKEQGNVDDMNGEIEKLQNDKRQVDGELSRLREEQQTMHFHSTTQTKLDMFVKEKSEKEDKIQKL